MRFVRKDDFVRQVLRANQGETDYTDQNIWQLYKKWEHIKKYGLGDRLGHGRLGDIDYAQPDDVQVPEKYMRVLRGIRRDSDIPPVPADREFHYPHRIYPVRKNRDGRNQFGMYGYVMN